MALLPSHRSQQLKMDMTVCSPAGEQINVERFYTTTEAAKLLGATCQTLSMYRKKGLVVPVQMGRARLFSESNIKWLLCARELIHVDKISIAALKKLLEYAPCWEIKKCDNGQRTKTMKPQEGRLPCMSEGPPAGRSVQYQSLGIPVKPLADDGLVTGKAKYSLPSLNK